MIRGTKKQEIIVGVILEAADRGEVLNVTQIHAALPYKCAYGSLRTSLRFLVREGILTRELAGTSSLMKPTPEAYLQFRQRR